MLEREEIVGQLHATWRRHHEILLLLLAAVPPGGFAALPAGSRGRDVSRQFAHLNRVRVGWLHLHRTGRRAKLPRGDSGPRPTRAELRKQLTASGKEVERFLGECLEAGTRPRMFDGQIVRWIGYLISHESHHRGQIVLALRQSGHRLPARVAMDGMWGKWIFGR